jgi:hypothetical protein
MPCVLEAEIPHIGASVTAEGLWRRLRIKEMLRIVAVHTKLYWPPWWRIKRPQNENDEGGEELLRGTAGAAVGGAKANFACCLTGVPSGVLAGVAITSRTFTGHKLVKKRLGSGCEPQGRHKRESFRTPAALLDAICLVEGAGHPVVAEAAKKGQKKDKFIRSIWRIELWAPLSLCWSR